MTGKHITLFGGGVGWGYDFNQFGKHKKIHIWLDKIKNTLVCVCACMHACVRAWVCARTRAPPSQLCFLSFWGCSNYKVRLTLWAFIMLCCHSFSLDACVPFLAWRHCATSTERQSLKQWSTMQVTRGRLGATVAVFSIGTPLSESCPKT